MISPYPVQPVQGNLLGSIMDFLNQRTAQQVEAGTRGYVGGQMGLPNNVDPFKVQGWQGENQRQFIAGDTNRRANVQQGWEGDDRQAVQGLGRALSAITGVQNDPYLAAMAGNINPAIAQHLLGAMSGDRSAQTELQNRLILGNAQYGQQAARDATMHGYQMEEIGKQNEGRTGSAGSKASLAERQMAEFDAAMNSGDPAALIRYQMKYGDINNIPQLQQRMSEMEKKKTDDSASSGYIPGGDGGAATSRNPEANMSPAAQQQVASAIVQRLQGNQAPEEFVRDVVRQTMEFGGYPDWERVRAVYPDLYNKIWNEEQKKAKQTQEAEAVRRIIMMNEQLRGGQQFDYQQ